MDALQFATDHREAEPDLNCSWQSIISRTRSYALSCPSAESEGLNEWADLLEGIRQLRGEV